MFHQLEKKMKALIKQTEANTIDKINKSKNELDSRMDEAALKHKDNSNHVEEILKEHNVALSKTCLKTDFMVLHDRVDSIKNQFEDENELL